MKINKNLRKIKKLETYLRLVSEKNISVLDLIPIGSNSIDISNFERIGGGIRSHVYSFELTYEHEGLSKCCNLVLKTYRNTSHPILNQNLNEANTNCIKEFQTMHSLLSFNFPVPRVYFSECNPNLLGSPFLIMQKEEAVQNISNVDYLAETLARLHNLKVTELGIQVLRTPKDDNTFARYWLTHLKHLSNVSKSNHKLQPIFDPAVSWLEANVSSCHCPRYCLVHGDYHPGNTILTKTGLSVLDWEGAEIGDPAFDVAYAYHMIKFFSKENDLTLREKIADNFVSKFTKNFEGDISARLEFYKVITVFRVAIYAHSSMLNPFVAYKRYGLRALFKYPLVYLPCASKKLSKEFDFPWINYFQDFMNKILQS